MKKMLIKKIAAFALCLSLVLGVIVSHTGCCRYCYTYHEPFVRLEVLGGHIFSSPSHYQDWLASQNPHTPPSSLYLEPSSIVYIVATNKRTTARDSFTFYQNNSPTDHPMHFAFTMPPQNTTFRAHWDFYTGEPWMVTFLHHDGTVFLQTPVFHGDNLAFPANVPTKNGYHFINWTRQSTNARFEFSSPITQHLTLTPHFINAAQRGNLNINSANFDMVFHPFFASPSSADMNVTEATQIRLMPTINGVLRAGDDVPSVARDYRRRVFIRGIEDPYPHNAFRQLSPAERRNPAIVQTHYEFLIKNGIRFSDGTPLTIQDVLFNMYVYLDPVYSGHTGLNSLAILGLNPWRTQLPGVTTREQYYAWRRTFEQAAVARRQDLNRFWNMNTATSDTFRAVYAQPQSARERRIIEDAQNIRREFWYDLVSFWHQAAATDFCIVSGAFADAQWFVPTGQYNAGRHMGFNEPWQVFLHWFGMISVARDVDGQIDWTKNPIEPVIRPDGPFTFGIAPNLIGSMPTLEHSGQRIFRYDMIGGVPVPVILPKDGLGNVVAPESYTRGQFAAVRTRSNIYNDDGVVVGQYLSSVTTSGANGNVDLAIPVIRSGLYTITQVYNNWLGLLTDEEIGRTARLTATGAPILAAEQPNINSCVYSPATDWIVCPVTLEIMSDCGFNGNHFRLFNLQGDPAVTSLESRQNTDRYLMARLLDSNTAGGFAYRTIRPNIFSVAIGWDAGNRLLRQWVSEAVSDHFEAGRGTALSRPVSQIDGITVSEARSFSGANYGFRDFGVYHHVLNVRITGLNPNAIHHLGGIFIAPMHYYSNNLVPARTTLNNPLYGYRGFNMPGISFNRVPIDNTDRPWISCYDPSMPRIPGFYTFNRQFFSQVFQATEVQRLPMGAGPFMATNRDSQRNSSNIDSTVTHSQFFENQTVRFIYNPHFHTTGQFMHNALTRYKTLRVMPNHAALNALNTGSINFGVLNTTASALNSINNSQDLDYMMTLSDRFSYVGINASRVRCIYARQAIAYAMNPELMLDVMFDGLDGDASQLGTIINRPISKNSWAFDHNADPIYEFVSETHVRARITQLLHEAGYSRGPDGVLVRHCDDVGVIRLSFNFAIIDDYDSPNFAMFSEAARILNSINFNGGNFDIVVTSRTWWWGSLNAGTLDVWAGSMTMCADLDLFRVFHRNSSAVAVHGWGFPWLIGQGNATQREMDILASLSDAIEASMSTMNTTYRKIAIHEALDLLMELGIIFPSVQTNNLFAFRSDIVHGQSLNYGSGHPLEQIWRVRA